MMTWDAVAAQIETAHRILTDLADLLRDPPTATASSTTIRCLASDLARIDLIPDTEPSADAHA